VNKTVAAAVSAFGASAKAKLANIAVSGAPEDQLRGPLEELVRDLSEIGGLPVGGVQLVGETSLADLKTRPDFAVTVSNALVGFIEVKAPGKGADPRRFGDPHDKAQWDKLKSLPNLVYTDGNAFSLWRDGEIVGKVVTLDGDVETSGAKLEAPLALLPLISDFLQWTPIPPRSAKQLAQISARLCRLLRDEVIEQMAHGSPDFDGTSSRLARPSLPASYRCRICGRICTSSHVRPTCCSSARHLSVGGDPVLFDRAAAFASSDVTVADPAVGTGTPFARLPR
jgi:hypothetical protein